MVPGGLKLPTSNLVGSHSGLNPSVRCLRANVTLLSDKLIVFKEAGLKIIYFISPQYPYEAVIYPGVGPLYAKAFGWPTVDLDKLSETECDIGIVDNRLAEFDFESIDAFLASPERRFPLFFKLSDPDMPTYADKTTRYILAKKDVAGVHYISIYNPEGPLKEFIDSMKRSKMVRLPFPYDSSRELARDFDEKRRGVFLSGTSNRELYPLRALLRRQRAINPLLRLAVTALEHPGYPEYCREHLHNILFERFIEYAARFSHFFLCGSRYRVELMRYIECAYANCVPFGEAPIALKDIASHCFVSYSGRATQLVKEILSDRQDMRRRAAEYRKIMRIERDPVRLNDELKRQIAAGL